MRDTMYGKVIVLGFLLFQILCQISGEKLSDYYTAAVVEYSPIFIKDDIKLTYEKNTDEYINYIERASKQNADIIVFPEAGLTSMSMPIFHKYNDWTTVVPSSQDNYIPCTESRINGIIETVKRLSCAARDNRIYVVINVGEKRFDEKNGTWHYHNTNIIFDRIGKIIARYRKVHLTLEGKFESSVPPDLVTFDTDFGVRFGVIICFDMLFKEPALNLTRIEGVSNIVYPTAWFSEVPFITAIQYHSGWAYSENVNVLSAGYNKPEFGSIGSGIYSGRNGIINVTMSTNPKERLLVSRVPKTPRKIETRERRHVTNQFYSKRNLRASNIDLIKLKHDHVTWFNSVLVNNSMDKTICYGNFCCDFLIRTDTIDPSTYYHAVVYDGIHVFEKILDAGVRLCAVIQCSNQSLHSCTSVDPSDTTFSTLKITARFNDYSKILVTPTVIDSSLIPFQHWSYDEQTCGEKTSVTIALEKEMKNVINFGIYSRNFQRDKYYE